jgi:hypothetical protein
MMRITEGQLRKIIREELLREGAMKPKAAKREGVYFEVKKRENFIEISARVSGEKKVGFLSSTESDEPCAGAWSIEMAEVSIDGLGPLLYDLMIDLVNPHPLMSDREDVSRAARKVWKYYRKHRSDIESIQLDDLENTLTPVDDDNCEQSSAMEWSDDKFGDESGWPKSSLSKAYRRAVDGTPTLDELQELGLISFV